MKTFIAHPYAPTFGAMLIVFVAMVIVSLFTFVSAGGMVMALIVTGLVVAPFNIVANIATRKKNDQ